MLNTELPVETGPQSILVIGCGLIGTSFALAVQKNAPTIVLDGVEINPVFREQARAKNVFRQIFAKLSGDFSHDASPGLNTLSPIPDRVLEEGGPLRKQPAYDLIVLAVPVDTACALLPLALQQGRLVMDVCSVKEVICKTAERLQERERFIPSHPMAGLASAGPTQATDSLFQNRPWLFIKGWATSADVLPLIEGIGARIEFLESASLHDEAMAIVSHTIHLVSLSAMLAYGDATEVKGLTLAHLTGPGFRDITRLSASPSEFWASTLGANVQPVVEHLGRVIERLRSFQSTLAAGGAAELVELLDTARKMHEQWKGEQT